MLKEGDRAPDFELASQEGKKVRLSDFKGKRVALYFYVRDFTPGCTNQAISMRDGDKKLHRNGIVTIGISTDSTESHKKFAGKYGLKFVLLADNGAKTAKAYNIYGVKTFMGRKFMGVKRTTFLIDDGKIIRIMPKVDTRNHAEEVLEAFRAAKA